VRVALVHDWLTGMRGGERCLEVFAELFPDADLFTLVHVPGSVSTAIERRRIRTSFIQHLPRAATSYRSYLPLFPLAVEQFDLKEYDLIISASHCVAKGVRVPPDALHLSYCFTPMRYVWDLYDDYFGPGRANWLTRLVMTPVAHFLRRWDVKSSRGVHHFVAISSCVADRIQRWYGREADVIYPPVDIDRFHIEETHDDSYLVVSALAPYKRIDLAILAANQLQRPLRIIGTGQDEARLRRLAGPTVDFLGWRSDQEIALAYANCRALLFPGLEDFGIVPLEAMASGRPVIAYGAGGALETVVPLRVDHEGEATPTGVLFSEQTVEALMRAIETFEANVSRFDPKALRAHAARFDRPIFKERVREYIARRLAEHSIRLPP
jgi:glycosyltransferase involved in cell wall biosynthesis